MSGYHSLDSLENARSHVHVPREHRIPDNYNKNVKKQLTGEPVRCQTKAERLNKFTLDISIRKTINFCITICRGVVQNY